MNWLRQLFWKRCYYCKLKKEYFYYIWELPRFATIKVTKNEECEICTDCANK